MLLLVSEWSKESIRGGRRIRALAAAASHTTGLVSMVYCSYIIHVHYIDEHARIAESARSNKQDRVAWSRNGVPRPSYAILETLTLVTLQTGRTRLSLYSTRRFNSSNSSDVCGAALLSGWQLKRKANNGGHLRRWHTSLLKADVHIIVKFLLKFL